MSADPVAVPADVVARDRELEAVVDKASTALGEWRAAQVVLYGLRVYARAIGRSPSTVHESIHGRADRTGASVRVPEYQDDLDLGDVETPEPRRGTYVPPSPANRWDDLTPIERTERRARQRDEAERGTRPVTDLSERREPSSDIPQPDAPEGAPPWEEETEPRTVAHADVVRTVLALDGTDASFVTLAAELRDSTGDNGWTPRVVAWWHYHHCAERDGTRASLDTMGWHNVAVGLDEWKPTRKRAAPADIAITRYALAELERAAHEALGRLERWAAR